MGARSTVFVYGTLLRGYGNHRLLEQGRALFLGRARTAPQYTLVSLGPFPGLIAEGATAVHGELYAVDDETLAALDRLEGHPRFYARKRVEIAGRDEDEVWGYFLPAEEYGHHPVIDSGDWRTVRGVAESDGSE
jgi:gamma-glutamylaminecyclotransferase